MADPWIQIAQGIPGGVAFLVVIYAVKSKQLRVGYEVEDQISDAKAREQLYKDLWESEKAESAKLVESRDGLVQDLQVSSETLNATAQALQTAYTALLGTMERRRGQ